MKTQFQITLTTLMCLMMPSIFAEKNSCKNHKAQTIEVKMLNRSPTSNDVMVFDPPLIKICPGDSVEWIATDIGHNSASLKGPQNGETWQGSINENIKVTFNTEGTYFYQCTPHIYIGMAGVVIVGKGDDAEKVKEDIKTLGKKYNLAAKRLTKYFDQNN